LGELSRGSRPWLAVRRGLSTAPRRCACAHAPGARGPGAAPGLAKATDSREASGLRRLPWGSERVNASRSTLVKSLGSVSQAVADSCDEVNAYFTSASKPLRGLTREVQSLKDTAAATKESIDAGQEGENIIEEALISIRTAMETSLPDAVAARIRMPSGYSGSRQILTERRTLRRWRPISGGRWRIPSLPSRRRRRRGGGDGILLSTTVSLRIPLVVRLDGRLRAAPCAQMPRSVSNWCKHWRKASSGRGRSPLGTPSFLASMRLAVGGWTLESRRGAVAGHLC